jgi:hypothetical protein
MMKRKAALSPFVSALCVLAAAATGVYGCSSDSNDTPATPTGDGGAGSEGGGNGNTATFTGQMIGYTSQTGVEGVTVTALDQTATTDSKGSYKLTLAKNTAFNLTVTDPKAAYFTEYEMEMKITGDYDHGKLRYVDKSIGQILLQSLKADATKAIVSVGLKPSDACTGKAADFPAGAKITVDGQPDAKVIYYKGSPSPDLTEAQANQDPAAIVANATPGTPLKLTVTYDKCTRKEFPVSDKGNGSEPTITYTGNLSPKADNTLNVYRIFYD